MADAKKTPAPSNAPDAGAATPSAAAVPSAKPAWDPTAAEVVRVLTLPLIKLRAGITIYVKPTEPMHKAKPQKRSAAPKEGEKAMDAPTLMHVVDLQTGELAQIIPGTILEDIFNDDYPNESYVGRGFKITVGEQKAVMGGGGKRYNQYTVAEIKLPA